MTVTLDTLEQWARDAGQPVPLSKYEPQQTEPTPTPTPTPGAWPGFEPLVPPLQSSSGAGNQPPKGATAYIGTRICPHPMNLGKRVKALHFKGKEDVNYAAGTPRWDMEVYKPRLADGRFDGATGIVDIPAFDARSRIDQGNWSITLPTPLDLGECFWAVLKDVDGDASSFASQNFLRMNPVTGQRHVSNEWTAADKGHRTLWGLDPRSVVVHKGTYVSSETWGWYGSSTSGLLMLPTYVIEYDDGTYDGQPYYGGWGQVKPEVEFTAYEATRVTGIVATGGAGPAKVTVGTATATVQHPGGGPKLTRLPTPLSVPKGAKVRLSFPSGGSLAMDSAWHSKFGKKLTGYTPVTGTGYGMITASPVSW